MVNDLNNLTASPDITGVDPSSLRKSITSEFTQEVKDRWLAALRSGEFKQGYAYLHDGQNGYCCLGVLAALLGTHTLDLEYKQALDDVGLDLLGPWDPEDPATLYTLQRQLAALNNTGLSFEDIADWIEENVPAHA